jgi:aspartate kinase
MLVMKFGGTSVGDGERILQVARLVAGIEDLDIRPSIASRKLLVISAMSGVTDMLLGAAKAAATHDGEVVREVAGELRGRHQEVARKVAPPGEEEGLLALVNSLVGEFESLCHAVSILGELTPRGLDAIASIGERLSVRLVAAALRKEGLPAVVLDATELIVTDDNFTNASPLMEETEARVRQRLLPPLEQGKVPVVTGFIGATEAGTTTTLGRGGSDLSAAILGYCLDADEVWIWTDVDGVMTADPRIVPEARTIAEISYAEVAELSYFGAKVLHPKTVLPAMEKGIPIRILNTFNPIGPNTVIVAEPKPDRETVKGITSIKEVSLVTVEGRGMLGVPGIAARVFSAVAGEGISVLMISQSSSEQNICFVIRREETGRALKALEKAFAYEMARRNVDRIWAQEGVAIIAVVGAGMKGTPGIAAKVFGALGWAGINVVSIAQGSSEYNLSLVVSEEEADEAVRAIHKKFELGGR